MIPGALELVLHSTLKNSMDLDDFFPEILNAVIDIFRIGRHNSRLHFWVRP